MKLQGLLDIEIDGDSSTTRTIDCGISEFMNPHDILMSYLANIDTWMTGEKKMTQIVIHYNAEDGLEYSITLTPNVIAATE